MSIKNLPTIYTPKKVFGCYESMDKIQVIGDICALLGVRDIDFELSVRQIENSPVYHLDMWFKSERQMKFFMKKINH